MERFFETIDDKLFERFLSDETTFEESILVANAIKEDDDLKERYLTAKRFNAIMEAQYRDVLPMEKRAAKDGDNMCVIRCEQFVLEQRYANYDQRTAVAEIREEHAFVSGLSEDGVHLYNIGRILEEYGFSVTRQFECPLEKIKEAVATEGGDSVIAVVNQELLTGDKGDGQPNHAVCILSFDGDTVTLFNPGTGYSSDKYPLEQFLKAWKTSNNFAVFSNHKGAKTYNPQPYSMFSGVELDSDQEELIEPIAEILHDIWGHGRIESGWTYGPERNDHEKKHPDLVAYSDLPESEKDYDRRSAEGILKLLKRLGFRMERSTENDCHCPECGKKITMDMIYCSECGHRIEPMDFSEHL